MKKSAFTLLISLMVILSISAQTQAPAAKPDERLKNLDLVAKTDAVPDAFKAGFESISARDSLAMLAFIASDLMEGRETGTRGFQAAAEYAASLFGLAKLKPVGDPAPRPMGNMMQMLSGSQAPPKAPEATYLQEFPLVETTESSTALSLEVRQGGSVRSHTFRPAIDYLGFGATGDTLTGPVVFVGYGIGEKASGFDEYKGLDVKGKIVLMISGAPDFLPKEVKAKYATPSMAPPPPGSGGPA
ncbi:MAG: hypothetical protein HGA94_01540, partial [Candidatus Aminicenantes bacterium]|nr:hypothetical protein [Candidatus Aminicenantes bacterium]